MLLVSLVCLHLDRLQPEFDFPYTVANNFLALYAFDFISRRKEGVFWLLVQLQGSQGLDRKKGKEKENRLTHVLAASDEDSFLCGW